VATTATAAPAAATAAEVPVELGALAGTAGTAGRRGVVVAGAAPVDGAAVHRLAEILGWPVLAEPRSPAWIPAATGIVHLDAILRSPRAADGLRPEAILRVGAPGASRVVTEWLAASGADEVVVGAPGWSDPGATAATVVGGPPAAVLSSLASRPPGPAPTAWLQRWRAASHAAATAVGSALAREPTPNEPAIACDVVAALPDGARLVVASSMPIRDVERYAAPRHGVAVTANRGANGIDGTVSTAVGLAIGSGAPTALLTGDLAFLHDSNGLLGVADRDIDLVCVVVDNDGGGIFSFLPQARALPTERFEPLFGTPHGLDLVALAAAYGVAARPLGPDEEVGAAVREAAAKGGVHAVVARTDRAANVGVHARVDSAVAAAVDAALF
jgi:2-succinyl-5-enolpyruvyl-6-hydroxy-3-cyclohexene-1-carboxylate synthase